MVTPGEDLTWVLALLFPSVTTEPVQLLILQEGRKDTKKQSWGTGDVIQLLDIPAEFACISFTGSIGHPTVLRKGHLMLSFRLGHICLYLCYSEALLLPLEIDLGMHEDY